MIFDPVFKRVRRLFHLFCCTTWHIFEPLLVYEPGFNTDKYSIHPYFIGLLSWYQRFFSHVYNAASAWPRTFLHPGCFCLPYHYFLWYLCIKVSFMWQWLLQMCDWNHFPKSAHSHIVLSCIIPCKLTAELKSYTHVTYILPINPL